MITNQKFLRKIILWVSLVSTCIFSYSHASSLEFEDNLNSLYSWIFNNYSELQFNQNWNNFEWIIFWRDIISLTTWVQLKLWINTLTCYKQIRWFYYNNQRWLRIWPLDLDSLSWLKTLHASYNSMIFTGWLFLDCDNVDENNIYGQIIHTLSGSDYYLIAWAPSTYSPSVWYTIGIFNWLLSYNTFSWYIFDNYGGTARVTRATSLNTPDDFYFDSIEEANIDTIYKSNTITISWLSGSNKVIAIATAWDLIINWTNIRATSALVWNWDKIQIQLTSSSDYDDSVESELFIWSASSVFMVTTMADDGYQLTTSEKLQLIVILNVLKDYYKDDPIKQSQFLNTFKTMLKDKIDIMKSDIDDWNEALNALDVRRVALLEYLYDRVNDSIDDEWDSDSNGWDIYTAPNGKEYTILFDDDRQAYTSNNFMIKKYFANLDTMKMYIDENNAAWAIAVNGSTLIAPNGKVYLIRNVAENIRTSPDLTETKYFYSFQALRDYIYLFNKKMVVRNHQIDTAFDKLSYKAPNGKAYEIYKTTTGKYFSYKFWKPIYFDSLVSIKKYINLYNQK